MSEPIDMSNFEQAAKATEIVVSGYDWLILEPLYARGLTVPGEYSRVLVYDAGQRWAAIIGQDPDTGRYLTNGNDIDFGDSLPQILSIFDYAQEAAEGVYIGNDEFPMEGDWPYHPKGARSAPGQAEENWVVELACGHEIDSLEEYTAPTAICSVHGEQAVIREGKFQ